MPQRRHEQDRWRPRRTLLIEAAHSYRFLGRIRRNKLAAIDAVPDAVRESSAASSGFLHTTSRSPGQSGLLISTISHVSNRGGPAGGVPDRRATQRADPVETGGAQGLLYPRRGEHVAVAGQDHMTQPEALLQLGNLGGDGGRIAGISFDHLDRHWTAIHGTQQADHQLRAVSAAAASTGQ
jgi:hypothetical protein